MITAGFATRGNDTGDAILGVAEGRVAGVEYRKGGPKDLRPESSVEQSGTVVDAAAFTRITRN